MDYDKILILDFGGQYSQLIARRVREFNVYSVIRGHNIELEEIKEIDPAAIIFSGGPDSVTSPGAPGVDQGIFELGIPILGICYGMQLMAQLLEGGHVEKAEHGEYGKAKLELFSQKKLFKEVDNHSQVWMSHGDHVKEAPAGFEVIAKTELTAAAAIADFERDFYGVQFHPEVNHTIQGKTILHNFLFRIADVNANWNMADYISQEVERIRKQVGKGKVICGLSGGVDSAVASAIVHKAIGDQLTCIFVDHGLLRKGEAEQVKRTFGEEFNIPLIYVDAKKRFIDRLSGITDPEEKRKIIGDEFIQVFD